MYLSMIDPIKTQSIDADLPLYCAFSFPAVLQTLGPRHWPLLKPTFDSLASDMQVHEVSISLYISSVHSSV